METLRYFDYDLVAWNLWYLWEQRRTCMVERVVLLTLLARAHASPTPPRPAAAARPPRRPQDIFPFFEAGDMMDRHGKMPSHRQDTAFPRRFLEPLARIAFAGANASCPNSHVEFLEYKFGAGVVGNPRYPQGYEYSA